MQRIGGAIWERIQFFLDYHPTLPMRGLKKTAPDGTDIQTHKHRDSMTESAQWGPFSEKEHYKEQSVTSAESELSETLLDRG